MQAQSFHVGEARYSAMSQSELVQLLASLLTERGWLLATAESCTGGGVASACTDFAGSSQWFAGSIVSYSNAIKTELLGVTPQLLATEGAVSRACAAAMAGGVQQRLNTHISVSTTGVAGPGGGSTAKPVGMVCFGLACGAKLYTDIQYFSGDRAQVRALSVQHALTMLVSYLTENYTVS